jgi:hypothetical protein
MFACFALVITSASMGWALLAACKVLRRRRNIARRLNEAINPPKEARHGIRLG